MSIFGSIMSAIFGHGGQNATASPTTSPSSPVSKSTSAAAPAPATQAQPSSAMSSVDVETVLTRLAAQKKEKLDWRHSIVDLMKLLDLDSGLPARQRLALELHYLGDMNDSASMNIWLHKQVMTKLAENGGKVPPELMH
jgi:hypothetical protein